MSATWFEEPAVPAPPREARRMAPEQVATGRDAAGFNATFDRRQRD